MYEAFGICQLLSPKSRTAAILLQDGRQNTVIAGKINGTMDLRDRACQRAQTSAFESYKNEDQQVYFGFRLQPSVKHWRPF